MRFLVSLSLDGEEEARKGKGKEKKSEGDKGTVEEKQKRRGKRKRNVRGCFHENIWQVLGITLISMSKRTAGISKGLVVSIRLISGGCNCLLMQKL